MLGVNLGTPGPAADGYAKVSYKGRGRRERGGRGYCGRGASRPDPMNPRRLVIPAKAGTYWRTVIPA